MPRDTLTIHWNEPLGAAFEWRHDHVSIQRQGEDVLVSVGNGGDFGSTDLQLAPEDAIALANALVRAANAPK